MQELSKLTHQLIARYSAWYQSSQEKTGTSTISVDEVTSKVASFYEKMRGVIDWREEHLLRKTAVERVLKRRLFFKKNLMKKIEDISEPLIQELIRGGHFPNESIPEAKIDEVQKLIDKYVFIIENAPNGKQEKMKIQLYDWLLSVAACEIESVLSPPAKETALMDFMLEIMKERVELKRGLVTKQMGEDEKNDQLYIAIQRALFKLDQPTVTYNLLKRWYPDWNNLSPEELEKITRDIYGLWEKIDYALKHPLSEKFYNVCERYDTPYLILGDIISQNPLQSKDILEDPQALENKIKEVYGRRLKKVKSRMSRAAFYSTVSIFITKVLMAFAVEVPFDKYITGQFDYMTAGLSVLIPPALMFFLVLSIHPPSRRNEGLVVMEVMKIVYARERKDVYEVKPNQKRGLILNTIIGLLYLLSFVVSYGFIVWGLQKLHFSTLSIIIFLIFVSLISFAGIKIRQRAKELVVEKEKETFLLWFADLFSLPVIQMGRWLSNQWTKYNAVAVIFNSLIDMPFQIFIEFLEQWRSFLREKKEKIH